MFTDAQQCENSCGVAPQENNETMSNDTNAQWTQPDIKRLFGLVKNALPDHDAIKYSTAVNLLDWNKLKFKSFTGPECKAKLLEIMESTRCYRTLTEVVNDAEKIFSFKQNGRKNSTPEEFEVVKSQSVKQPAKKRVTAAASTPDEVLNDPLTFLSAPNTISLRNRVILIGTKRETSTPLQTGQTKEGRKLFLNGKSSNNNRFTNSNGGECSSSSSQSGDKKYNVSLRQILSQTNWSKVVVNCGDKVDLTKMKAKIQGKITKKTAAPSAKSLKKTFKRKGKKKNALKRPTPPVLQYFAQEKDKLREENPGLTVRQLAKIARERYKLLTSATREVFITRYREQKAVYEEKIKKPKTKNSKEKQNESEEMQVVTENIKIDPEVAENENCEEPNAEVANDAENVAAVEDQVVVKIEGNNDMDILANVQSGDIGRDYWGLMMYAEENLCRLTHTKTEDKLDVISNLWRSLEDYEREGYTDKALKLGYGDREKAQAYVFSQVNIIET